MTVATFQQPDYTTQTGTAYPLAIDASMAVMKRIAAAFSPHAQSTPDMTVRVDSGALQVGVTLTEVSAQNTGTITAPVGNPRIDRVVVDAVTGAVSVITGTPAGSPTAPALTAGKLPVAQVLLQTSSTVITNSMITDERAVGSFVAAILGNGPTIVSPSINTINLTGGQIAFPATQAPSSNANTLDDYEEGTWTPSLSFSSDSTGIAYASDRYGTYIKIGKFVFCPFVLALSSKGSAVGNAEINGLPFASYTTNTALHGMSAVFNAWFNMTTAMAMIGGRPQSSTQIRVTGAAGAVTSCAILNSGDFSNSTTLQGQITYQSLD